MFVPVPVLSAVTVAVAEIVEVRVLVIVSELEGVLLVVCVEEGVADEDTVEVAVPLIVTVAELLSVCVGETVAVLVGVEVPLLV